jgi:hypothetical protein
LGMGGERAPAARDDALPMLPMRQLAHRLEPVPHAARGLRDENGIPLTGLGGGALRLVQHRLAVETGSDAVLRRGQVVLNPTVRGDGPPESFRRHVGVEVVVIGPVGVVQFHAGDKQTHLRTPEQLFGALPAARLDNGPSDFAVLR